jgi:hypothetical protein
MFRFSSVIPADWNFDGPPWGVTRRDDGRLFRFVLVALDGESLDWRIYGLVPLSEREFGEEKETCEALLAGTHMPDGSIPTELQRRIEEIAQSDLTNAALLVLTLSLTREPGMAADVPCAGGRRYEELVNPTISLESRLSQQEQLIVSRAKFMELVEFCFGYANLPPLEPTCLDGSVRLRTMVTEAGEHAGTPFFSAEDVRSLDRNANCLIVRIPESENKQELLHGLAAVLRFPSWFGLNWDALYDCLRDLNWIAQRRIVLIHPVLSSRMPAADSQVYLDVLRDAIDDWATRGGDHELAAVFQPDDFVIVEEMGFRRGDPRGL